MRQSVYLLITVITMQLLVNTSTGLESTGWPLFKYDERRSGFNPVSSGIAFRDLSLLWNYSTGSAVKATPVTSDLDSDGLLEVVVASTDGRVYVLSSDGGLVWNYSTSSGIHSTPALRDVDGDSIPEVVFGSEDGRLYVLNASGTLLWSYETGGRVRSSPLVTGLDVYPGPEIVFGSMDENVYCLDSHGKLLWDYHTGDPVESSPAVADIDSDGDLEVVVGSSDNVLYALQTPPLLVWSYLTNDDVVQTPTVDRYNNIYVPSGRELYKLHYSKSTTSSGETISLLSPLWIYNLTRKTTTSPVLGPIQEKTGTDIVFAAGKELTALDDDGRRIFRYTVSKPIKSTPALADLNGDDVTDIILGSTEGMLYIINHPGKSKWSYNLNCSPTSPGLGDLTSDGSLEILVGCDNGRVYAFGSWKTVKLGRALNLYNTSLKYLNTGNLEKAAEYAKKAEEGFTEINNSRWAEEANTILQNIEGYGWFFKASHAYERGELIDAKKHLANATLIFTENNYEEGLENADELRNRLEADLYLLEARHLYGVMEYQNASAYANAARAYYIMSDNDTGVSEADSIASFSQDCLKVYDLFDEARYSLEYDSIERAVELLNESLEEYSRVNDSHGVGVCPGLISLLKAYDIYLVSLDLFYSGEYERSVKYADSAAVLFSELGLTGETNDVRGLLSKTSTAIEAEKNLRLALSSLNNSDYDSAVWYSSEALRLYNYSGIEEGVVKSLNVLNISKAREEQTSFEKINRLKKFILDILPLMLLVLGFIIFLAFSYFYGKWRLKKYLEEPPGKEN